MLAFTSILLLTASVVLAENCPTGGAIYTKGISNQGKIDVINAHNNYRNQIMAGTVPGQPRGKNLKKMVYNVELGEAGRAVSDTCVMKHILAKHSQWNWIGQNLYISWSSQKTTTQDWAEAVKSWFSEHKNFVYPNKSNGVTGHYTQVVWANSEFLGCDFIAFYDNNQPQFPYARLYTCNYGPGGNVNNNPPYQLA